MCDVRDPRILATYYAITEDEPTNWLILGYNNTKDTISLYSSGTNGLAEFREHLTNEILFGFVREEDRFVLINYVPDNVSGVRRARALVHSRSVASILELSHAQITASSLSDLSDSNVRTRLKLNDNVVPNRPRPISVNKRTSYVTRKRTSMPYSPSASPSPYYSPSPSPAPYSPSASPSPMSERNLKIYTEPESLLLPDPRSSQTSTPVTPTSIASVPELPEEEPKKRQDEATIMNLLQKKKEQEAARFKRRSMDEKSATTTTTTTGSLPQLNKFQQIQQQMQQQSQQQQSVQPRRSQTQPQHVLNHINHVQTQSKPQIQKTPISPSLPQKQQQQSPQQQQQQQKPLTQQVQSKKEPVTQKATNENLITGFASIQSISSPLWKRRYFEIQNNNLLIYRDEMSKTPILDISLTSVTRLALTNEDEDTFVPNSFILDTQLEHYQIYAENKKSAREIFNCLKSLISVS